MAHSLGYQIHRLCKANPEGSFGTQHDRSGMLKAAMKQLRQDGYRFDELKSLKPKHTEHLVKTWQRQGLSPGTIKNRTANLRWLGQKLGKPHLVASNKALGIENRSYIASESKAKPLSEEKLSQVQDNYTKASLRLQEAFGLRTEESIKFWPKQSVRGAVVALKGSWCKGGRPRTLEIRTDKQREAIQFAQKVAGNGALIPPQMNYVQQLNRFKSQCANAKIDNVHGYRHHYAQQRYKELTGREAPVNGGLSRKAMTKEERLNDNAIRLQISQELGHSRLEIVATYIGS